ncbi:MAG: transglycosylase domain-containing protein [Tissierellia bacterium]|nr:transglycosylase domain-containing protein [Tissierellia bacterium]
MQPDMNKKPFYIGQYIKIGILLICIFGAILAGALGGSVVAVVKEAPEIDLSKIGEALTENSTIVDAEGSLLEKIETAEYREVVSIETIPQFVKDAFVAVEDERFYEHMGVDIMGIGKSVLDNISAGDFVRGGSTITQQLARDLYLNDEKTLDRKIKEAYIAMKMNDSLSKDEVLEIYLNRVFLGQNAYGVQAAADTYFSKNLEDLTIAEAAALAAIPKAPTDFALYKAMRPEDVGEERVLGEIVLSGEKYFAAYNPGFEERQQYVLSKMLELGMIDEAQYQGALTEDIAAAINPPERRMADLSSYFTSLVKAQVVDKLMSKFNLTRDEALDKLYNGGLKITATIDLKMQRQLEDLYEDFTNLPLGDESEYGPKLLSWELSEAGNIENAGGTVLYFDKLNLLDQSDRVVFYTDEYEYQEDGLHLKSHKVRYTETGMMIKPFYTITDSRDLRTHAPISISIPEEHLAKASDGGVLIANAFLEEHPDFIQTDGETIAIDNSFYMVDDMGILQPQASTVVMDHNTGHIKAIIGGRGQTGYSILNRAYSSLRQPGSTMKPISVYAPALDNKYTLASIIDDLPHYNDKQELWPINWYGEYRGLTTIRESIEVSANVNAVKMLEKIGLEKSKEYLKKFGLINGTHPELDNFISKQEDPFQNDENTAAMALGGMTYGLTNVELTAAYAAIANRGTYIEPLSFSKVEDRRGNVVLENEPETNEVISEGAAYLVTDALHSTTQQGIASNAQVEGYDIAGKTGTSGTVTENQDSWFVGFSPYYTVGVWIGADDPQLKLNEVSLYATNLWNQVNTAILEGYSPKTFDKYGDIVEVEICTESGLLPTDACRADHRGAVRTELFIKGTEPKKECSVHVWKTVDTHDGLLITERTPKNFMSTRSFITRAEEYDPTENGGILPTDWYAMAPTSYSPVYYPTEEELAEQRKKDEEDRKKREQEEEDKKKQEQENPDSETEEPSSTSE